MKKEATQLAANRHFLYEDFVAYELQQSWLAPEAMSRMLAKFLSDRAILSDTTTIAGPEMQSVADELMAASAEHARVIDKAIRQAFGPRLTEDPNYDVETAPDYHVPEVIAAMDQQTAKRLLVETGQDFERTGAAARSILTLCTTGAAETDEAPMPESPPVAEATP
jgi:hypothetical protein